MEQQKNPERLSEAARQARNAYQREYRRRNKERVRGWNDAYWARRAQRAEAAPDRTETAED